MNLLNPFDPHLSLAFKSEYSSFLRRRASIEILDSSNV